MSTQCEICLTKAKCKHKTFGRLLDDCQPLRADLYNADKQGTRKPYVSNRKTDFAYIIKGVFDSLHPTKWELGKFGPYTGARGPSKKLIKIIWKDL